MDITEQQEVFEFTSIGEIVNQTLQKNIEMDNTPNGLSTGFSEIDKITSGLQKGQLVTIAVRPGMGKTAFLLSMTNNIAIKNGHSVAIFSSERSSQKITNRIIESETGMSIGKLRNIDVELYKKDHLYKTISNIAKAKIYLDDSPNLSSDDLKSKSRKLKFNYNVELIIIDYLELLRTGYGDNNNREEQLNTIVHTIKSIAKEINVPIVLFSQLQGYGLEYNMLQNPSIKDIPVFLSELSDVVMFLYRKNFINKPSREDENVEMILAKYNNQNHNTVVPLKYIERIAKFADS